MVYIFACLFSVRNIINLSRHEQICLMMFNETVSRDTSSIIGPSNFRCRHCACTIFVLISYSFHTQVMLILILIDVQYSQNVVFSFAKGLNCQNHFSSGSHHPVKKLPPAVFITF